MELPRVLVVDDEEELVTALVERLSLRGFEARGVTSGAQALRHLADHPCDVVLLDVKMPGLSGLELIEQIKSRHPDLQVVLLTGRGSAEDAEAGMGLGAFEYLTKPVKIDDLIHVLLNAGGRRD